MVEDAALVSRREFFCAADAAAILGFSASVFAKRPACGDVDTCREQGQKKFDEAEKEKGDMVRLGNGVSY